MSQTLLGGLNVFWATAQSLLPVRLERVEKVEQNAPSIPHPVAMTQVHGKPSLPILPTPQQRGLQDDFREARSLPV